LPRIEESREHGRETAITPTMAAARIAMPLQPIVYIVGVAGWS
jgi:hypothetical protein